MKSFNLAVLMALAAGLIGCASDQVTQKKLEDGKLALEQNQIPHDHRVVFRPSESNPGAKGESRLDRQPVNGNM